MARPTVTESVSRTLTFRNILLSLLLLAWPSLIQAEAFRVETPAALQSAVKAAQPGDLITLVGSDWHDVRLKLKLKGTSKQPVTVRSQITFTGSSSLDLNGEHVVLDGFTFRNGSLKTGHVLRVRGAHNRVTRCTIENYNPDNIDTRYQWLSLNGHHHRVDHCRFAGQNHSGTTLVVWLDEEGEVGRHRIERNYFLNRQRGKGNGFETIRIGTSETSMKSAQCVVSENLFENCDGEIELISNKSCDNVYERNTIVGCAGALTLRHGNNCIVRENLILGDGDRRSGGIRIVGEGHQIIGNHIEGVGNRIGGAIALSAGVPDPKLNQHARVRHILIDGNTLIDNDGEEIVYGHGLGSRSRSLLPEDVIVKNTRRSGQLLLKRLKPADVGPDATGSKLDSFNRELERLK
ncbi:polysaccharide lyase 6 family protein [Gimesia panareensis]|uniref:polysaccharide lyase 6 family protein n=1 Tax=Gimesia panareensis TaxID=2527978 RepID=UPI0018DA0461|nr:polysaccharide lyase 6 family protein [Gimesia panareensis]